MEETINRSMIIEANSYPGAIIAYMDWFERPGIQYDDTGRFLGWENLHTILGPLSI